MNLEMVRGDTFIKTLTLKKNGQTYTPHENDVIKFTVCKGFKDERGYKVFIQKTIDHQLMQIKIESSETESMLYGNYNFDMEITYNDGTVETFARGNFKLLEEAT